MSSACVYGFLEMHGGALEHDWSVSMAPGNVDWVQLGEGVDVWELHVARDDGISGYNHHRSGVVWRSKHPHMTLCYILVGEVVVVVVVDIHMAHDSRGHRLGEHGLSGWGEDKGTEQAPNIRNKASY